MLKQTSNEQIEFLVRDKVERLLMAHGPQFQIVHECPKCLHRSIVDNSTPFGVEQVISWITQFAKDNEIAKTILLLSMKQAVQEDDE